MALLKFQNGIRRVATAVCGNVIETINNKVLIIRIKETEPVARISMANIITSPEIEKDEIPKTIEILKYAPTVQGVKTVFEQKVYIEDDLYTFNYNAEHTGTPYNCNLSLDEGSQYNITGSTCFLENRALYKGFKIPLPSGETGIIGDCTVKVTANVIEINSFSKEYSLTLDSNIKVSVDNESVDNDTQAQKIFEWISENYKKCFKYKVEIQDTFTYELGDTILLETNVYVNGVMIVRKAIITSIEYSYNGALHYYLTLKGA